MSCFVVLMSSPMLHVFEVIVVVVARRARLKPLQRRLNTTVVAHAAVTGARDRVVLHLSVVKDFSMNLIHKSIFSDRLSPTKSIYTHGVV
jgi:hypothetical protein